ncbi:MAG: DUF7482 domain-containing protein [Nitrososphaeraceae archaeon]
MPNHFKSSPYGEITVLIVLVSCTVGTLLNSYTFAQAIDQQEHDRVARSYGHYPLTSTEYDEVALPISKGFVDGKVAYFIATDASNNETANSIFENTGWRVNFAPILSQIPQTELSQGFEFLNGIQDQGAFGFQLPVSSSTPDEENYSPLVHLNLVRWNDNVTISVLKSTPEIISANQKGDLQIIPTNITINSPAVSWFRFEP